MAHAGETRAINKVWKETSNVQREREASHLASLYPYLLGRGTRTLCMDNPSINTF